MEIIDLILKIVFQRNMKRPVTHWYTKDQPIFENTEDIGSCVIDVTRIPGGSDTPPCLKISHNTFETMEKANWEFLRLSLPVSCQTNFIDEKEKSRRWEEIRLRQHRILAEVEHTTPAHINHIMQSGFTMNDIKGLHRNYSEDAVEADEVLRPSRPSRKGILFLHFPFKVGSKFEIFLGFNLINTEKFDDDLKCNNFFNLTGSMSRNGNYDGQTLEVNGRMQRSTSNLDVNDYEGDEKLDDKKKRGRSPFRLFGKKRDQSKDKIKGKGELDDKRLHQGRNVIQSNLTTRNPTVRVSNADLRVQAPSVPDRQKTMTLGSQQIESIGNEVYDSECLKLINEYFYGVRIYPGQDPTHGRYFSFNETKLLVESVCLIYVYNSLHWMGHYAISSSQSRLQARQSSTGCFGCRRRLRASCFAVSFYA